MFILMEIIIRNTKICFEKCRGYVRRTTNMYNCNTVMKPMQKSATCNLKSFSND